MVAGLGTALPAFLDRVGGLFVAWHRTPTHCRDRLVAAVAFCIGTQDDRSWVVVLEAAVFGLAVVVAFVVGRATAHLPITVPWGHSNRVVLVGRSQSRFKDDDSVRRYQRSRRGPASDGEASW